RIDLDLIERVRRLASGHVHRGRAPPRLAAVVGAIQLVADDAARQGAGGAHFGALSAGSRVLVFEQRVQNQRVPLIDVESDAANLAGGESAFQSSPRVAAVVSPVNAGAG